MDSLASPKDSVTLLQPLKIVFLLKLTTVGSDIYNSDIWFTPYKCFLLSNIFLLITLFISCLFPPEYKLLHKDKDIILFFPLYPVFRIVLHIQEALNKNLKKITKLLSTNTQIYT